MVRMSDELTRLTESFAKFPGVGPRQAQRMVYYLLRQNRTWVEEFAAAIKTVKQRIGTCAACFRHFIPHNGEKMCGICSDASRTHTSLMLVEKDVDLDNIERSGAYAGTYFVLGGTVSALEKEPQRRIYIDELKARITRERGAGTLKEIIFALSATPDGDDTAEYVQQTLAPLIAGTPMTFSTLGRGLSTGSELEYADKETIKQALERRN